MNTSPSPVSASGHAPTSWHPVMRTIGAVALLVVGGIHFQQYHYAYYSSIPTIGPLFLANFVAATGLGLFLLARIRSRRVALADRMAALAGIGVAGGALLALLISERAPLFGFREDGYRFVIVLAIASELVTIALLSLTLSARPRETRPGEGTA